MDDVVRSQGGLAFCEDLVEVDGCEDVVCCCVCCWGGHGGGGCCGSDEEGDVTQRGRRRVDVGGFFVVLSLKGRMFRELSDLISIDLMLC